MQRRHSPSMLILHCVPFTLEWPQNISCLADEIMAIWKVNVRVARLPYFHVLPCPSSLSEETLELVEAVDSHDVYEWWVITTSNPTGHGDLSLNRPEIETIEEAFSCVVLVAKRHLKIRYANPMDHSIPKMSVEKHVLTCYFPLLGRSLQIHFDVVVSMFVSKWIKAKRALKVWFSFLKMAEESKSSKFRIQKFTRLVHMTNIHLVSSLKCWGSVVPAPKFAPGVGPRLCNGCWDPVNLVAGLEAWILNKRPVLF